MKAKRVTLNDGTIIIEGLSKLIVIEKEFANEHFPELYDADKYNLLRRGVDCYAKPFTTRKGREAILVKSGNSHILRYFADIADRSWGNWKNRRIVNALFSEAKATSNGGGCWLEVEIWEKSVNPVSAQEQNYMDEIP